MTIYVPSVTVDPSAPCLYRVATNRVGRVSPSTCTTIRTVSSVRLVFRRLWMLSKNRKLILRLEIPPGLRGFLSEREIEWNERDCVLGEKGREWDCGMRQKNKIKCDEEVNNLRDLICYTTHMWPEFVRQCVCVCVCLCVILSGLSWFEMSSNTLQFEVI